ncbi:MAG TPA: hypothetical protein P5026_08915 [Kiritimatiellia bacterium]|nr:hypothetical protein [Kiritimatiellia bacterium]HRU71744.1 hypothetical protein [Kiritimatiellia bacterium]
MRVDMQFPVLVFTLLMAALMQDLSPVIDAFPVKPVFLTAVALYAALTRPIWVALTAAVWAGGLTDTLGDLPPLCTPLFLMLLYGSVRLLQRVFLVAGLLQGALLTAAAAAAQWLWTRLWLHGSAALATLESLKVLGYTVQAGLLAGLTGFVFCGLTDRLSGLVKPVKEGHGILWAETDR